MKFNKLVKATANMEQWPTGQSFYLSGRNYKNPDFNSTGFGDLNGVTLQNWFTNYVGGPSGIGLYFTITIVDINNVIIYDNLPLDTLIFKGYTTWQKKFLFTPDFTKRYITCLGNAGGTPGDIFPFEFYFDIAPQRLQPKPLLNNPNY